jgi:signal transduction histidine kinase
MMNTPHTRAEREASTDDTASVPVSQDHDHFVQYYESDVFLIGSIARFIGPGLIDGDDSAIVAATPQHRDALEKALEKAGCDVERMIEQGRYVALDADDLLARFMVDDRPDPMLFSEVVGGIVARVAAPGRRVRIFGEMVAQLWAAGNVTAAADLEELWNKLAQVHPFTLFCAYPIRGFEDGSVDMFERICDSHSRVIPAESYTQLESPDERLREIASLQHYIVSEDARIREREEFLRRRQAFDLNDAVIQGLAVAKFALELGDTDKAVEAVEGTLTRARSLLSSLFGKDGALDPGELRRASEPQD